MDAARPFRLFRLTETDYAKADGIDKRLDNLRSIFTPGGFKLTLPSQRPYNLDPRVAEREFQDLVDLGFRYGEEDLQYASNVADFGIDGLIVPMPIDDFNDHLARNDFTNYTATNQTSSRSGTVTPKVLSKKTMTIAEYQSRKANVMSEPHEDMSHPRKFDGQIADYMTDTAPGAMAKCEEAHLATPSRQDPKAEQRSVDKASATGRTLGLHIRANKTKTHDMSRVNEKNDSKASQPNDGKISSTPHVPGPISLNVPASLSYELPAIVTCGMQMLKEFGMKESSGATARSRSSDEHNNKQNDYNGKKDSKVDGKLTLKKGHAGVNPGADHYPSVNPTPKKSLITKLKIPKLKKTAIADILSLDPSSRYDVEKAVIKDQKETNADSMRPSGSREVKISAKPGEKRAYPLEGSSAPTQQLKRPKLSNGTVSSKLSTPSGSIKSPNLSQLDGPKRTRTTAVGNSPSTDSGAPKPHASPDVRSHANGHKKIESPPGSALFSTIRKEYEQVGYNARKQYKELLKSGSGKGPNHKENKLARALMLESFLAYMLSACISQAYRDVADVQDDWKNATKLLDPKEFTDYPFLQGLTHQLKAVCSESVGHSYEKLADYKKAIVYRQSARSHLKEAIALLPVSALKSSFPKSFRARAEEPLATHKPQTLDVKKLDGEYYLPLSAITTGIEAVRAGRAMLSEWCKNEMSGWKATLEF